MVAMSKYHRYMSKICLKQQKYVFSEFWSLDTQDQGDCRVNFKASLFGLQMAFLCVGFSGVSISFYKGPSQIDKDPIQHVLFYLIHLFKDLIFKYGYNLRYILNLGVGTSMYEFWETIHPEASDLLGSLKSKPANYEKAYIF